jgi:hypothetical protein
LWLIIVIVLGVLEEVSDIRDWLRLCFPKPEGILTRHMSRYDCEVLTIEM